MPFGGISPARILRTMMSQPSRSSVSEVALVKGVIFRLPLAMDSLWQGAQVVEKTGATALSKAGLSAAHVRTQVDSAQRTVRNEGPIPGKTLFIRNDRYLGNVT